MLKVRLINRGIIAVEIRTHWIIISVSTSSLISYIQFILFEFFHHVFANLHLNNSFLTIFLRFFTSLNASSRLIFFYLIRYAITKAADLLRPDTQWTITFVMVCLHLKLAFFRREIIHPHGDIYGNLHEDYLRWECIYDAE